MPRGAVVRPLDVTGTINQLRLRHGMKPIIKTLASRGEIGTDGGVVRRTSNPVSVLLFVKQRRLVEGRKL